MSFILDALKKSENARQRQAGPALFEVKVAPPRRSLPVWAIVIGVLLGVNGAALAWIVLHRSGAQAPPAHPGAAAASAPAGTRAATRPAVPVSTSPRPAPRASAAQGLPTLSTPTVVSPGSARETARKHSIVAPPAAQSHPGDFAPAVEPASGGGGATSAHLPLYAQIAAAPGSHVPKLHLDLHVYASDPSSRFVMINMHKLHQGSALSDGVTVVKIRPDGVVLSYHGRRFLLPR